MRRARRSARSARACCASSCSRPGSALRRFARVRLARRPAPPLIARVEAPEDPAGRPTGVAARAAARADPRAARARGLPVPRRLGGDAAAGIELLEDVGELSLAARAPRCSRGRAHARSTTRPARWCRGSSASRDPGGVAAFARRARRARSSPTRATSSRATGSPRAGRDATPAERACVRDAFARIAARDRRRAAPARAPRLPEREPHVLADARPGARLAMIDLQGAFLAPPEYDLVCLLRDSYVELPEAEVAAHFDAMRRAAPRRARRRDASRARFDLLTLARKGKDHARFLYVARAARRPRALRLRCRPRVRHLRARRARARRARDARLRRARRADRTRCRSRRARDDRRGGARHAAAPAHRAAAEARPARCAASRSSPTRWRCSRHHGVREVVINTHHLPEKLEAAARAHCPPGLALALLARAASCSTRAAASARVADFLRESDPCLLVGGDMLLDVDLGALVRRAPRARRRRDAAAARGSARGRVRHVGVDARGACAASARASTSAATSDARASTPGRTSSRARALRRAARARGRSATSTAGWAPLLAGGRARRARQLRCPARWEPVGTPAEYLAVNLRAARLRLPRRRRARARARGRALRARVRDRRWRVARRGS